MATDKLDAEKLAKRYREIHNEEYAKVFGSVYGGWTGDAAYLQSLHDKIAVEAMSRFTAELPQIEWYCTKCNTIFMGKNLRRGILCLNCPDDSCGGIATMQSKEYHDGYLKGLSELPQFTAGTIGAEELNGKYEEGERERRQRLFEVEASGNGGCMDWNQLRQDIAWLIRKEHDWQMLYHREVLINHSFTEGSERA